MRTCPICESGENTEFFTKGDRSLLICRDCRHIWWRDLPGESEVAAYYRAQYTKAHSQESLQEQAREYYRNHVQEMARILKRRPSQTTLLDYGCSIPVLGHEAVKLKFKRVLGVDWADEARESGRAWGVEVLSPPELGSVPDRSIDIARFSHTIEHSISPLELLRTVLPKLRLGGLVYITQPNFPVFLPRRSPHDLRDTVYPEHLHFFSALSLIELVSRLNVDVIRFFSHQKDAEVAAKFREMLDLDYARDHLQAYASRGDCAFPQYANFPFYAGENSVLYALVR